MQLHPELTEKLYAAFPRLYRGRHNSLYESSMCWGFECGDGWYPLLYDLSSELSNYLAEHPELDFEVVQVKSKFGRLRFHLSGYDVVTEEIIELACQRASVTCEFTGKPGQLCGNSARRFSMMVLCPEKAAELGFSVVSNNAMQGS
ncbi:MAG: hypothetical protein ACYC2R_11880 [Burkholderiales bacterium]